MVASTLNYQTRNYTVTTPVFEGPLDLLLRLIERAELDITKLALALVTDQYLEFLHDMGDHSPDEVSAFIVIATRLIQIKSEALLPRPPVREQGEEDPGEALVEQLRAYRRYKQISELLGKREAAGTRSYVRLVPPPQINIGFDWGDLDIKQFYAIARQVFIKEPDVATLSTIVSIPVVTIREKIALINRTLLKIDKIKFRSLIDDIHSRIEIVVTFLAILELIKRHLLKAQQEELFGEIVLETSTQWNAEAKDLELEFGD